MAVAEAAAKLVDSVWFVLAKQLPHKRYEGVPLEGRLEILQAAVRDLPWAGIAVTEGGLFLEMAREARHVLGPTDVRLLCGRDAAERIVNWPYPAGLEIERQLEEYQLLVASRQGSFFPEAHLTTRVVPLAMPEEWSEMSATFVRAQLASEPEGWQRYVPAEAVASVAKWYAGRQL